MANGEVRLQEKSVGVVERRQCTVMFCDIVDYTRLSTKLDSEDQFHVRRQFEAGLTSVMKRHGGTIAQNIGDAVVVLFGYPTGQEDAAERAMRAALDVVPALQAIETMPGEPLQVRLGIATGETVVYVIETEVTRSIELTGAVPTLASRLQASAEEPGQVIVSEVTRQLVGDLFEFVELDPCILKGFEGEHRRWSLQGEAPVLSRFTAVRRRSSRLVGRSRELSRLSELWRRAESGEGQIVLVHGEAGIGKSRLVESVCAALPEGAHDLWRYSCSPHASGTVLYPLIRAMEVAGGIVRRDAASTRLAKLEALVAAGPLAGRSATVVPYLAQMLDIPLEGSPYTLGEESPEWRRKHTIELLLDWVIEQSQSRPVALLVEDLHWADPSTLELIRALVGRWSTHRILVIATARPEFSPTWEASPRANRIPLRSLDRESCVEMVRSLIGNGSLSEEMIESIAEHCDGNPLYLEELTRSALESPGDKAKLFGPSALNDLLMQRLDRLSEAKRVAQTAAAIGREFSIELLAAVSELDTVELAAAIDALDQADLVQSVADGHVSTYRFRHALVRDAAYNTMLRQNTLEPLHERIGMTLETSFPDIRDTMPELLAHHFELAHQWSKAVEYWRHAGHRAASRAANAEACAHLEKALALLGRQPPGPQRDGLELDVQCRVGIALSAWQGYGAPGVERAYDRAREICRNLQDPPEVFGVLRGLSTFHIVRARLDTALDLAQQCVRMGLGSGQPDQLIEGYTALGYITFYHGRFEEGLGILSKAVDLYASAGGEKFQYPSAQDPGVASLSLRAHALCLLGRFSEARQSLDRALALADRLGRDTQGRPAPRPFEQAYARGYGAMLESLMGNADAAMEHAQICIGISQKHGFLVWLGIGTIQYCNARIMQGGAAEVATLLEETFKAFRASGAEISAPVVLGAVAAARAAQGDVSGAMGAVDEGLALSSRTGERYVDSNLRKMRGQLLVAGGRLDEGLAELRAALSIARNQGAALFELLAAEAIATCCTGDEAEEARNRARTLIAEMGADSALSAAARHVAARLA
jgi:class 3 adenylate cyclase/tetratricopeptide (TPR) repeat protein